MAPDGRPHLLAGDDLYSGDERGRAYVFLGRDAGLPAHPDMVIENPTGQTESSFGNMVALCDLDSDGRDELIIAGLRIRTSEPTRKGAVFIYHRADTGTPAVSLELPVGLSGDRFERDLGCGD